MGQENKIGLEEGEICNRLTCNGEIELDKNDGDCSCEYESPCWHCKNASCSCKICGWNSND